MLSVGVVQLSSSDIPSENLSETQRFVELAADQGAQLIVTPEVTNIVSASRTHQNASLQREESDDTLRDMRALAQERRVWLLLGSIALKTGDEDGRFANRSFLIAPDGQIAAHYDKIHMFDVNVSETESYRESAGYRPGAHIALCDTDFGRIGMTICYDVRFPDQYRKLAQLGASVLTVPSAFSPVTGAGHWEMLLRARAIETGSFVLAPAQTGTHRTSRGKQRQTYGHSMVIDPWGEILLDAGTEPGVSVVNIDLSKVEEARSRIPSLSHDRDYTLVTNAQRYN